MKRLILIIGIFIGFVLQAQVPDSTIFSFTDVQTEFVAHETGSWDDLLECANGIIAANSPSSSEDPSKTWWELYANSLYGFRAYSHQTTAANLLTDLISVWELNETSAGDAVDSHGLNDFTNSNTTINQTAPTNLGTSYLFNGSTSYLYRGIDNNLTPTGNFSFSFWVKRSGAGSTDPPAIFSRLNAFSSGNGVYSFRIYDNTTNNMQLLLVDSPSNSALNASVGSDIWTGNWVNVVVTSDGTNVRWYINAVEQSHNVFSAALTQTNSNSYNMIGGQYRGSPTALFNGYIDQVAMWGKTLTQAEITQLYNSGNGLAYINW